MQNKINSINGHILYQAFLAGANRISYYEQELNKINVFPVQDQDTGTNLASTIQAIVSNSISKHSAKETLQQFSETALMGAKGNSGVIFSQLIYGFEKETRNKTKITILEFVDSLKKSIPYIYESIANPIEGTILTVIIRWIECIEELAHKTADYRETFLKSIPHLRKFLQDTTNQLAILKKHKVVDAGAKGFVIFIEGITSYINGEKKIVHNHTIENKATISDTIHPKTNTDKINYRYCTEAVIKNCKVNKESLMSFFNKQGDSFVYAGNQDLCRIHIHCNQPEIVFDYLHEQGKVIQQKAEDMILQNQMTKLKENKIAIVTDSACDLPKDLIEKYQIHILPLHLHIDGKEYLDGLTITPHLFYQKLSQAKVLPSSSQVNEDAFVKKYQELSTYYDSIISIHLSKHFSGTFSCSEKAARKVSKEKNISIHTIDSKNVSGTQALIVLKAAEAIQNGKNCDDVISVIENTIKKTSILVSVKDLKYMVMGGRVPKPVGYIARKIGINPIVSLSKDGKALLLAKTLGQKANVNKVIRILKNRHSQKPISDYIILHANDKVKAENFEKRIATLLNKNACGIVNISPIVGKNAGEGSIAIAFI